MNKLSHWLWRVKLAFLLRGMTPEQRTEAKRRMALELVREHSSVFVVSRHQKPNIPYTFHREN